jgi:hypothetical protein
MKRKHGQVATVGDCRADVDPQVRKRSKEEEEEEEEEMPTLLHR